MVLLVSITVRPNKVGAIKMKKIIRFTASWCQPCKIMATQLENMKTNLPIEVLDIDAHPEIAMEYGIRSVPTLVMMEENTVLKRLVGVKTPPELRDWIND